MNKLISTELADHNIAQVLALLTEAPPTLEKLGASLTDEQCQKPLADGECSLTGNLAHLLHCEATTSEVVFLALLKGEDKALLSDIHPEREFGKLLGYDLFTFSSLLQYFKFR